MVTIDCSDLLSDFAARLLAGEPLSELMPDLHYGILAELEECLRLILAQLQSKMEVIMNNPIGNNNNSEPTTTCPSQPAKGVFLLCDLML